MIACVEKLYDQLLAFLGTTISKIVKKASTFSEETIKRLYVLSAKTHIADMTFYLALCSKEQDIFYQPIDSDDWSLLISKYTAHDFPSV